MAREAGRVGGVDDTAGNESFVILLLIGQKWTNAFLERSFWGRKTAWGLEGHVVTT